MLNADRIQQPGLGSFINDQQDHFCLASAANPGSYGHAPTITQINHPVQPKNPRLDSTHSNKKVQGHVRGAAQFAQSGF